MLDVVIGMLWVDGRVLLGKRPPGAPYPGYWEFPGGKVEEGENDICALQREWLEETGLQVRVGRLAYTSDFPGHAPAFRARTYWVFREGGELSRRVHSDFRFVTLDELATLQLTPTLVDAWVRRLIVAPECAKLLESQR